VRGTFFQALQSQQETTAALWPRSETLLRTSLNNLRTFAKSQTGAARQPPILWNGFNCPSEPSPLAFYLLYSACVLIGIYGLPMGILPQTSTRLRIPPPPSSSFMKRRITAIPNYQCFSGSKYILLGSQLSSLNQIKEDVAWKIIVNRLHFPASERQIASYSCSAEPDTDIDV